MQVAVLGGGAAGTTAALEIRRRIRDADITIIESQQYPEYSPCALPFVIDGTIESFDDIILHDQSFFSSFAKIRLMLGTIAESVDTSSRTILTSEGPIPYDVLVLATGSYAFEPPIPGLGERPYGIRTFLMKTLDDASAIKAASDGASSALVVGAGLVGMETAVALHDKGLAVTVMEGMESVLPQMLDPDMSALVVAHLEEKGITFRLSTPVEAYEERDDSIAVTVGGAKERFDICVIACGVRAETRIAQEAGIDVDGAIVVDAQLRTSAPDVYACGDCVTSQCAVSGSRMLSQLGSTAVRQAKVLATAIAGGTASFPPTFNTAVTHLGGLDVGVVGVTAAQAKRAGIEAVSSKYKGSTLPEYYPGGEDIYIRLLHTADGRILGGQVIGTSGVLVRTNMLSYAMQLGAGLSELAALETAYTPPLSPTVDPLTVAAELAVRKASRRRGNR